MKKYTKRLLAFLLATVMVLTGLPINATEAKAADEIVYNLAAPTVGVSSDGTTITNTLASGMNQLTTSFAGTNWALNPSLTTAPLVEGSEIYVKLGTNSAGVVGSGIQKWSNSVIYTQVSGNLILGFDLQVPAAGEYIVTLGYNDRSGYSGAFFTINDTYLGESPSGNPNNSSNTVGSYTFETPVTLEAGTANLYVKHSNTGKNIKSPIMFSTITLTPAAAYAGASVNLTEGEQFNIGATRDLVTTATLSNGTDITNDITVTYASSDDEVATVSETGALAIVGEGNAEITATVTYNGTVAEVITRNISAIVEGTFWFDFTDVDESTLFNDSTIEGFSGSNRLYTAANTRSVEGAAVPWVINAELTGRDALCVGTVNEAGTSITDGAGRFFNKPGDIDNLRIMAGNVSIVFDFEAPAAGEYNLSAEVVIGGEKFGYGSVFVNNEYVGSVDCYTGMPEHQKLLSVTVNEGTNTLKVIAQGHSKGTDDYVSFRNIKFSPVAEGTGRKATALELTVDNVELDMAGTKTAEASLTATTDSDVIIIGDYTYVSSNEDVAVVTRTGLITAKSAGTTDITSTIGGLTDTVTITVKDSRPRYTVTWMNGETSIETDDNLLEGAKVSYDGDTPVKEGNAQYSYAFTGWNTAADGTGEGVAEKVGKSNLTYYAQFEETVNKYVVSFVVDGETVSSEEYEYGAMPVVPAVSNKEDADKVYTFVGWDAEVVAVTGEATYTAVFEEEVQNYTITFVDEDGTILQEVTVAPGDEPRYTGEEPTKAKDAQYTYRFAGWDKEVVAATGNEIYKAVYEAIVNSYTVTWVVGETEIPETYEYGATPEFKGETAKASTPQYTYTFTGWDVEPAEVKCDATYTAQYEATVREYTITFRNEDGSLIKSEEVAYGDVPVCEEPVKAEDVYATYEFAGWTPAVVAVEGEAIYQATYTATPKSYTVTWVVNGSEAQETYEAGKMPEAPVVENYGDVQYTYVFTGWDKDFVEVTEDVTYTAQFRQTVNTYTVTWLNHNGETILAEEVAYGDTPVAPAASYKEYAFLGWDKEIVAVEGEATYTAIYDIDGIDEGYYYVDGKVKGNAGVIQIGEDLYFVCYSGKIAAGQNMTVPANKTNNLVAAGTYYFFADGTMKNPADDLKGEIVNVDGTLWYYVKGEVRGNVGLVKIDDAYYYVHYSGKVVAKANQTVTDAKANGFATAGTYYFYANGVMATDAVKMSGEVGTDGYYYVYGELTKNVGLVKLANGDFVYVHYSGKVVQNGYQTVTEAKANGFTEFVGVRKFADGIMIQ